MGKYLKTFVEIVLLLIIFNIALTCISASNTAANIIAVVLLFAVIPFLCHLWFKKQ